MSQAYQHVKYLAEEIGPRGSCTAQERKAADQGSTGEDGI